MRRSEETSIRIAKLIIERGDEIIRQRKIKTRNRIRFAVSGICAASIFGFCVLNINQTLKLNNGGNDNYPVVSLNTTAENNSTTESTNITTETVSDAVTSETGTVSDAATAENEIISDTLVAPVTPAADTETRSETEEPSVESQQPEDLVITAEPEKTVSITEKAEIIATEPPATTVITTIVVPTLCGDVNGDGIIDIEDSSIIRSYIYDYNGSSWAEYYSKVRDTKISADQALANADTFRASDKREITIEDAKAVLGHINGLYPNLPVDELSDD